MGKKVSLPEVLQGARHNESGRKKMTQEQHYEKARRRIATLDKAFMDAVNDGMEKWELERLISWRPDVYGRFSNWLEKLPRTELSRREV